MRLRVIGTHGWYFALSYKQSIEKMLQNEKYDKHF